MLESFGECRAFCSALPNFYCHAFDIRRVPAPPAEKKRTLTTGLKLYVKPEEHAAYYVVNEKFIGSIFY